MSKIIGSLIMMCISGVAFGVELKPGETFNFIPNEEVSVTCQREAVPPCTVELLRNPITAGATSFYFVIRGTGLEAPYTSSSYSHTSDTVVLRAANEIVSEFRRAGMCR